MDVAVQRLSVMKYTASQDPSRIPRPNHSLRRTAFGAVVATVLAPVVVLAVAYPVTAAAVVGFALATWPLVNGFRQLHRSRKRREETRQVCVPKTGICAEV